MKLAEASNVGGVVVDQVPVGRMLRQGQPIVVVKL